MIKCEVCGREFNRLCDLSCHLKSHSITAKEYYDDFVKIDGEDGYCKICKKCTRFYSMDRGYQTYCSTKCMANDQEIKDQKTLTCLNRYGTEHPLQNDEIKIKYVQTCISKYGKSNPSQIPQVKQLKKKTCLRNFGCENPSQSVQIQNKKIQTFIKKFGYNNPFQNKNVRNKYKQTCLKKYGVDHHTKTFEFRLKCRELLLDRIKKKTGKNADPMEGYGEKPCFDELEKHIPYKIQMGTSKINYFPDGFIEELKLVIEFDEPEHQREWYQKHDKKRDKDFLKIGYETFRIKQIEWDNLKIRWYIIEKLKRTINDRTQP